jgi:hypothetical protein
MDCSRTDYFAAGLQARLLLVEGLRLVRKRTTGTRPCPYIQQSCATVLYGTVQQFLVSSAWRIRNMRLRGYDSQKHGLPEAGPMTLREIAHRLLLVEDDQAVRERMTAAHKSKGFEVVAASSVTEALRHIATESFDVLVPTCTWRTPVMVSRWSLRCATPNRMPLRC